MDKRGVLATLVVVVVVLAFVAFKILGQKQNTPQYETAQAQSGTLIKSVTSSGTISAGNAFSITTQASGVVTNVYVKNGDRVTQGQKIADISPDQTAQTKQAQAYASFVSASTGLQNAQNNLRSDQAALEKTLDDIHLFQYGNGGFANVGSANETETQKADRTSSQVAVDNATNSVNSAQASFTSASLALQQTSPTITAPISGTITNLTLTPGLAITPPSSTTATSSVSLGDVSLSQSQTQAEVDLSEIDVVKIKTGDKVTMTLDAFPNQTFTGRVVSIDTNGTVSSNVTTYPTTIAFDSAPSDVYPNMAVTGEIITKVDTNVITVPSSAVQTANGQTSVRELKNGQMVNVPATVGDSNDTETEITSGVNPGDTVVTAVINTSNRPSGATTSPFGGTNRGFGGAIFRGGGGGGRGG